VADQGRPSAAVRPLRRRAFVADQGRPSAALRPLRGCTLSTPGRLLLAAVMAMLLCSDALAARGAERDSRLDADPRIHPMVVQALRSAPRAQVLLQLDLRAERPNPKPRRREVRRAIDGLLAELTSRNGAGSFEVIGRFDGLRAIAASVDAEGALAAASMRQVRRVLPDSGGHAALLQSLPLCHLSDTRAAGFDGQGSRVAVIDSGIDESHPAFDGAIVDESCFCSTNCCPNGQPTQFGPGAAQDQNGHGTNVAGIMVGRGVNAPQGALPQAGIVVVRVLDRNGEFSTIGDIALALNWLNQKHPEVVAVNMSLETYVRYPTLCDAWFPMLATNTAALLGRGASLVAATGNEDDLAHVAAPACLGDVIGVAAVWDATQSDKGYCGGVQVHADQITCFSNRGPLADLLAPGAAVTAAGLGGGSSTYYGTSQASPMVAACAAVLDQANPAATPAQRLHAMLQSPTKIFDAPGGRTYPRLDCASAVGVVTASCGDANGDDRVVASDALAILQKAVGAAVACPIERCDFDGNGSIVASDALATLNRAVGQTIVAGCSGGI